MKFILIKQYPLSPRLGFIISETENGLFEILPGFFQTKQMLINNSEFWQPVKEKVKKSAWVNIYKYSQPVIAEGLAREDEYSVLLFSDKKSAIEYKESPLIFISTTEIHLEE